MEHVLKPSVWKDEFGFSGERESRLLLKDSETLALLKDRIQSWKGRTDPLNLSKIKDIMYFHETMPFETTHGVIYLTVLKQDIIDNPDTFKYNIIDGRHLYESLIRRVKNKELGIHVSIKIVDSDEEIRDYLRFIALCED